MIPSCPAPSNNRDCCPFVHVRPEEDGQTSVRPVRDERSNETTNARTYVRTYARTHVRRQARTHARTQRADERPNHTRVSPLVDPRVNTYCNIGVYFVLLPIFTDESAAELVHARRHYLKPLMALGEDGFERFDFLLESVQTSHLRGDVTRGAIGYPNSAARFTSPERNTDEIPDD